jgi:sodium/bile acid cotransporter 7
MVFVRKNWFALGLIVVTLATLADTTQSAAEAGRYLKQHNGASLLIVMIFVISGLLLQVDQVKAGLRDLQGTLLALGLIFIISPLLVYVMGALPIETGVAVGLILVAIMPTTLSSGVVMTASAGGNMAHALFITVFANTLAVFTIPVALTLLAGAMMAGNTVQIDKLALMMRLTILVMLPLLIGFGGRIWINRSEYHQPFSRTEKPLQIINQCAILVIVWMAVAQSRATILASGADIWTVIALSFFFHLALLAAAGLAVWLFKIERGRRESIIFMGGQKTLALAIVLQVSLFPQYGQALVFCVVHHLIHLIMDGFLVEHLRNQRPCTLPAS